MNRSAFSRRLATQSIIAAAMLVTMSDAAAQPFRAAPDRATFQWRGLSKELRNKMSGTFVVAFMAEPPERQGYEMGSFGQCT